MHRGNLHTRSSGISSMVTSSSSRTSSSSSFSSFSFLDAIVTRLRSDSALLASSCSLFRFSEKPCPFERFKSRKEFCSTIRQTSKGTNRSHSLRGTIERASTVVVLGARLHAAFRIISQIDTSAFGSHRSTWRRRVGRHRPNG
ncbi:hypothetical protein ALC60_02875 [Trachymyrmex zeteki]|uniref:Uncharacterized protein n=1 Tax=Mycetomoellerius zeteki TaxID=64791 RepID=A0A151XCQ5_9HYME|nr:hypothetical protein ALC60_02875 [Trachymyrmex zeteki]